MSTIDVKLIIRFVSIVVPIQSIVIDTMTHLGPSGIIKPNHASWLQPLARQDAAAPFAAGAEIVTLVYSCPAIVVRHVWELDTLVIKSLLRQFYAASDASPTIGTIWILLQPRVPKRATAVQ